VYTVGLKTSGGRLVLKNPSWLDEWLHVYNKRRDFGNKN
jgi:hypothetical protein